MAVFKVPKRWRQIAVTLFVNLFSIHLGVMLGGIIIHHPLVIMSQVSPRETIDVLLVESARGITVFRRLPYLYMLAALPMAALVCERFGRKMALAMSTIPFILFVLMMAAAKNLYWINIAMTFGAVACALQLHVVPIYVCEISSDCWRGAHGVIRTFFIGSGLYLGFFMLEVWLKPVTAIISLILPTVFLISLTVLPESPVWLARKRGTSQANKTLAWLRINEKQSTLPEAIKVNKKPRYKQTTNCQWGQLKKMFTFAEGRKRFAVTVVLLIGQTLTQINCIAAYFIATLGMKNAISNMNYEIVINIAILTVVCAIAALVIDRFGRRPLLIVSCIGIIITLSLTGGSFKLLETYDDQYLQLNTTLKAANAILAIGYCIFYYLGMGSIPSIIAVEIMPNNVVSYLYAISTGIFWIFVWIVTEFWEPILTIVYIPYWCFGHAVICLFLLIFVWFFVPETKKKAIFPCENAWS